MCIYGTSFADDLLSAQLRTSPLRTYLLCMTAHRQIQLSALRKPSLSGDVNVPACASAAVRTRGEPNLARPCQATLSPTAGDNAAVIPNEEAAKYSSGGGDDAAVSASKRADPELFQLSLTGVRPGDRLRVSITWFQPLMLVNGQYTLRVRSCSIAFLHRTPGNVSVYLGGALPSQHCRVSNMVP